LHPRIGSQTLKSFFIGFTTLQISCLGKENKKDQQMLVFSEGKSLLNYLFKADVPL
jgi:hypothetical protein